MADFYLDHDVSVEVQFALQHIGHTAVTTRDLHLERALDPEQLLVASRIARTLVTHNTQDFSLLHTALRLWAVPLRHPGILAIPQQAWTPQHAAFVINRLIDSGQPLSNELYTCSREGTWSRLQVAPPISKP